MLKAFGWPLHRIFGTNGKPDESAKPKTRACAPRAAKPSNEYGPSRLLSTSPPVFLSGIARGEDLGIARIFGLNHGNVPAGFVIFPTWSIERPGRACEISKSLSDHTARYPAHKFRFICNTQKETDMMLEAGIEAAFLNKNFMVSEEIFRPLDNASAEFDAVYVARFMPVKRHELAACIPRVGYVAYVQPTGGDEPKSQFRSLWEATLARNPQHSLLNDLVDGLPVNMTHTEVNDAINRAAVGLILSEVEGSSYASMEYLLAGLPVVSTPSTGGRDVYFDPECCIVCDADERSVRDAVIALRARNIPRETIRARTIGRIVPERERFMKLVFELVEELGGRRRNDVSTWPYGGASGVAWGYYRQHLEEFAASGR